jgi:hypothetical protein
MKTKAVAEAEDFRPEPPRNHVGDRKLTAEEIGSLAKRMVESNDPREKALLKEAIMRGFYGEQSDA